MPTTLFTKGNTFMCQKSNFLCGNCCKHSKTKVKELIEWKFSGVFSLEGGGGGESVVKYGT